MNIESILNSLSNLWARHSPTVIMHIAIFVMLQWWVLDPNHMLLREPLWQSVKTGVSSALSEAGITIPVGYALAVIGYVYLNVFQWLAGAIINLPGLRPWYVAERFLREDYARYAGQVLRTPPNMLVTREKLDALVENYVRRFRERGEPEPYQWLQSGISQWNRFYGLSVLGAAGAMVWFLEGGRGSASRGRVLDLALLLIVFASYARWQFVHKSRYRSQQLRYGALHDYEQSRPDEAEADELTSARSELLSESAGYWRAYDRHPTIILLHWASHFPPRVTQELVRRIPLPPAPLSDLDWEILRSKFALFSGNTVTPPQALSVDAYKERFRSLLECQGAGLFILTDAESGLAPSVSGHGSAYCFARRRHGRGVVTINYYAAREGGLGAFEVSNYEERWSFLADLGAHPVELAAQGRFPSAKADENWWALAGPALETKDWSGSMFNAPQGTTQSGISVRARMPVALGHSYLLRARVETGTEVVVVFQCFGAGRYQPDTDRLENPERLPSGQQGPANPAMVESDGMGRHP